MPELPEVETVIRGLRKTVQGQTIKEIAIYQPKLLANVGLEEFVNTLQGQELLGFSRHGKFLIWTLNKNRVVVHLRMEGKFFYQETYQELKHSHILFTLSQGFLHYLDTRRFGKFYLYDLDTPILQQPCFAHCGVDALSEEYNLSFLKKHAQKAIPLKRFLLDQSIVAGVGNLYADELAFKMGLLPEVTLDTLDDGELQNLITYTQEMFRKSIEYGGTSVHSFNSFGVAGRYQEFLQVYGRRKQPCYVCGELIAWKKLFGRGTNFCLQCQKGR